MKYNHPHFVRSSYMMFSPNGKVNGSLYACQPVHGKNENVSYRLKLKKVATGRLQPFLIYWVRIINQFGS